MKKRILYRMSLIICTAGLLLCGERLFVQWKEYRAGEASYDTLTEEAVAFTRENPEEDSLGVTLPEVDFNALELINPDLVGWLYCPDTVISYPVVQGEDNTYYLKHLFDGTQNSAGCLFLDSRCEGLAGANSVIYGHHMKNGTLFAALEHYQDPAYYEDHPSMYLLTPEGTLVIELFSAYVTAAEGEAWQLSFSTEEEFGSWLEQAQERSCFESDVTPRTTDRVITLSTCDYSYEDARFVCHGIIKMI